MELVKEFLDISRTRVDFGDACFMIHHFHWHFFDFSDEPIVSHSHQFYELHLVVSGEGTIDFGEKSVVLRPGEIVIIAPGKEHLPIQITGENAENLTLAFSVQKVLGDEGPFEYFSETLHDLTEEPVVWTPPPELISDLRLISKMSQTGSLRDYCYVKTVCCRAIFLLFDHVNRFRAEKKFYEEKNSNIVKKNKSLDKESMNIVLENLLNEPDIPLAQVARRLGFSERQTQRMILQLYGKSFRSVRQDLLFSSACRLFRDDPMLSIQDVCRKAGFSEYASMKKVFLKKCGKTPEEYRDYAENLS